jgi:hypothetical protein
MYEFCRVCFPYSTGNFLGADTGLCVSLVSITPNRIQVREEKGGSKHKKCQTLILFDLDPLVLPSVVGRGEGGKERERERERERGRKRERETTLPPRHAEVFVTRVRLGVPSGFPNLCHEMGCLWEDLSSSA